MKAGEVIGKLVIVLVFLAAVLAVLVFVWWRAGGLSLLTPPAPVATDEPAPPPPGPGVAPALARILARGELLVGMDTGEPPWTGTPPMYFPDASGNPDGFDYRLAEELARNLGGVRVKVVHAKYSELPDLLREGEAIDLLVSGYTPTEEPGVAWSDPYLEYGLCLVVPARSQVKSTKDLFGEKVGIFDDDAAAEEVGKLVKGYTELVRLEDGYWDQLLSGGFAGFIYDYPYAVAEINAFYRQNPHRKGAFRIAQYNLTDSTYAVGVRESEPDLLAAVNAAITAFRDSDGYAAMIKTYLSGGVAVEAPETGRVHEVQAGDTLSRIAQQELGDPQRWTELWALNKDRFPNPHLIEIGDKVALP